MQISNLFTGDDRAVSPVIGVILMVAITVILAAVIGSFVLGLGNSVQQTAPNANFDFDFEEQANTTGDAAIEYNVTATHTGGDSLTSDNTGNLSLTAPGVSVFAADSQFPFTAGSSLNITNASVSSSELPSAGETVRVIWTSQNGGSSQALAEDQIPS
ncbi:type IV pilin N-terminal domain-containing protein [Halobaculum limi]|uniref:type IV pilin N-terminal domain-containing protein n=1 Tax=Halobaculum limi TaxID=3031916 RepID=UPI0024067979|nr:type IV pilin N-terminal domain-containing protein [Halobaculum sp. YSMS11]